MAGLLQCRPQTQRCLHVRAGLPMHTAPQVGSDKIEAKYTSRAAQLYRKQLEKDAAKLAGVRSTTLCFRLAMPAAPAVAADFTARAAAYSTAAAMRVPGAGLLACR